MRSWRVNSALCTALTVALSLLSPAAVAVEPACTQPPPASGVIREVPWTQDLYDPQSKIWPFSTGAEITVAVLDSGVDARHRQLRGRVLPGYDHVRGTPEGDVDCVAHGTAVASIIAAKRVLGIGFAGFAPQATILPVRITERQVSPQSEPLNPRTLAAGIDYAVDQGAQVLTVSTVVYEDDRRVESAVNRALANGVVVVAAVGDGHSEQRDGNGPTTASLTPYPAAYDGVIGVGAVDAAGQRVSTTQIGTYVDVVAPGADVTAAGIDGHNRYEGTSFASAFVSAFAALLLSQRPSLLGASTGAALPEAVGKRLMATASPAAGGPNSLAYGHGLVDPYRALTERTSGAAPFAMPPHTSPPRDPVSERLAAERRRSNSASMLLGVTAAIVAVVVLAGAVFLPPGVRRRWRTSRAPEVQKPENDDGPEFLPGYVLFERFPTRSS